MKWFTASNHSSAVGYLGCLQILSHIFVGTSASYLGQILKNGDYQIKDGKYFQETWYFVLNSFQESY